MQTIIGVRFKKAGKIYYFSPGDWELGTGEKVIVETSRGTECGTVVLGPREVEKGGKEVLPILRIATGEDILRIEENKKKSEDAYRICAERIAAHHLAMKLVRVEYAFDGRKILCYFTADGRVDFRELVKDLASIFHMRIELRQIGVRDEAKMMGGIGCCGRPLCCATFLGDFQPLSIRMAKEQNLSLNPTKISGICGRLMCCLKYESEAYKGGGCPCRAKKRQAAAPEQGSRVVTSGGNGKVMAVNEQRRTATVLLDNHSTVVASWDELIAHRVTEESVEAIEADGAREEETIIETTVVEEGYHASRPRENRDRNHAGGRHDRRDREPRDRDRDRDRKNSHPRRTGGVRRDSRDGQGDRPKKGIRDRQRSDREPRGSRQRPRDEQARRAPRRDNARDERHDSQPQSGSSTDGAK